MTPQKTYDNSTSARELLAKYGAIIELDNGESEFISITQLLNSGVTEVIINQPYEIFTEDSKGFHRYQGNFSFDDLMKLANTLCKYNTKAVSVENPSESIRLPDGERGHIVIPPACEAGKVVFAFRKPSDSRFTLDDYIQSGRLSNFVDTAFYKTAAEIPPEIMPFISEWQLQMIEAKNKKDMATFFNLAAVHHCNICMVGGTGSGKTTFTKAIADLIDHETRIITIEDTHELSLPYHKNHAHLFFSNDEKAKHTAKKAIADCMRLKPDRIFLTELRGDEAWDYLSALNTGHAGGLTSVHANDSRSVFARITQLAKESKTGQGLEYSFVLNVVKSTIDVVCFFERTYMKELYFDPVVKIQASNGRW